MIETIVTVTIIGLFAGVAMPNVIRARKDSKATACINNLCTIDTAIQEMKLQRPDLAVTEDNIRLFIGRGNTPMPHCPAGGSYGDFDKQVTCSFQDPGYEHTLVR